MLTSTFTCYLAAQHHHWNVEGIQFITIHEWLETYYGDMLEGMDTIAERIRFFGHYVHNINQEIREDFAISGDNAQQRTKLMLKQLLQLNQKTISASKTASQLAQELQDDVTDGILMDRITAHEKHGWMLESLTKE